MQFVIKNLAFIAGAASAAHAKTIPILAKDLVFEPEAVNASAGDVLEFHFLPHNHSVVMGDYAKPCEPSQSGGFYSGFWPVMSGVGENETVFQVTINDTTPFVCYCSQGAAGHNHCKGGMAGTVNEDDGGGSRLRGYKEAAAALDINVSPASIFGGVLAPNANANTNATATETETTSASAPTQTQTQTSTTDAGAGGFGMAREAVGGGLAAVFAALMMA